METPEDLPHKLHIAAWISDELRQYTALYLSRASSRTRAVVVRPILVARRTKDKCGS